MFTIYCLCTASAQQIKLIIRTRSGETWKLWKKITSQDTCVQATLTIHVFKMTVNSGRCLWNWLPIWSIWSLVMVYKSRPELYLTSITSFQSSSDVTVWRHSIIWRHSMTSQYDVTVWRHSLTSQYDVTVWRYSLTSQYDVTVWRHSMTSQYRSLGSSWQVGRCLLFIVEIIDTWEFHCLLRQRLT